MKRAALLGSALILLSTAFALAGAVAEEKMTSAARAFTSGRCSEAATSWQEASALFAREHNLARQADALHNAAQALLQLGQTRLAIEALQTALELQPGPRKTMQIKAALGAARSSSADAVEAEKLLRESLDLARQLGDAKAQGRIANDLGNLLAGGGRTVEASRFYEKAAGASDKLTQATALANLGALRTAPGSAIGAVQRATSLAAKLEDSHEKVLLFLNIAHTGRRWGSHDGAGTVALHAATEARAVAARLHDESGESEALGFLGELYLAAGRLDESRTLTEKAAFLAQKNHMPDALFRWEWQEGRILARQGQREAAIEAYRRSLVSLEPIRHDLAIGVANNNRRSSFRDAVGPLFLELADLLLQQGEGATADEQQRFYREARDTMEQLKSAELTDYFQDDCVNLLRSKTAPIENIAGDAAVLYLIPLRDRTEILLGTRAGLRRQKLPVGEVELGRVVRDFRQHLETRTSYEYLTEGAQLYDWLIRPLHHELQQQGIRTLVFVPDGPLRTIPLAALYDGQNFLINEYAVAVTPGLTLMDARPLAAEKPKLLLSGLSDAVQGFPSLKWVPAELENIRQLYGGRVLEDEQFNVSRVNREIHDRQYSLVHIASHAQFRHDARDTFLLTHEGHLDLNDLERLIRPGQFRGEPVELMTLSACQTAAGDDRAALGLAGVAVKAGARSALATLWFVNDQSSSRLISEFYRQLHDQPALSKAVALQQAQLSMLRERGCQHPCYWAPYLLIGNWL